MSNVEEKKTTADKVEDIPEDTGGTADVEKDDTEADTISREVVGAEESEPENGAAKTEATTESGQSIQGDGSASGSSSSGTAAAADDEEEDDGEPLGEGERNKMFERALALDRDGDKAGALKCYLRCLVGLKSDSKFTLLPQCLRNIGDIYYSKDEYEKAISFIQAEKLYYESVLIDDSELQRHIDEVSVDGGEGDTNIDLLRASEFEQLAKLCMDEKQPQLALEYAGKATKLRQKVHGNDHPLVKQSLDYFATIYAEVGKVQYTESLRKYDAAGNPDLSGGADLSESQNEPTSILRKRKTTEGDKEEKKVRFNEVDVPFEEREREEKFAICFLFVLFLLLVVVLILLGLYIYCSLYPSDMCTNFRYLMTNSVMKIRFWFYQLTNKAV